MKKKDITILLVDDEPDILEIVGYNLTQEGYVVVTAENGLRALICSIWVIPKNREYWIKLALNTAAVSLYFLIIF